MRYRERTRFLWAIRVRWATAADCPLPLLLAFLWSSRSAPATAAAPRSPLEVGGITYTHWTGSLRCVKTACYSPGCCSQWTWAYLQPDGAPEENTRCVCALTLGAGYLALILFVQRLVSLIFDARCVFLLCSGCVVMIQDVRIQRKWWASSTRQQKDFFLWFWFILPNYYMVIKF